MMGFVKWLILQYQCYKLEKTFDNKETKEKHFMSLFSQWRDYGFDENQILYILKGAWTRMNKAFEKIVNRFKQLQGCDSLANMFISDVIKVIKSIEKEYNNGWIPCSERLPEDETDYLCCYEYTEIGGTHEGEKFKDYGVFYYDGYKWIKCWETINKKNIQVVAWQPLPEPYEEETEDE